MSDLARLPGLRLTSRLAIALAATFVLFFTAWLIDLNFLPIIPAALALPVWVLMFPPSHRSDTRVRRLALLALVGALQPAAGMAVFLTL